MTLKSRLTVQPMAQDSVPASLRPNRRRGMMRAVKPLTHEPGHPPGFVVQEFPVNNPVRLALASALWSAGGSFAGDAKAELKKLEGTWVGVSAVSAGKDVPSDKAQSLSLTMKADGTWTMTDGKETWNGTFTVDATKTPKTANFVILSGTHKDHTTLDIYEVDGDTFKCCYVIVPAGKESETARPTKFKSEEDSPQILSVMKWQKEK